MDKMAYLQQIAVQHQKPSPKTSLNLFSPKLLVFIAGAIILLIIILILTATLNQSSTSSQDLIFRLQTRSKNLSSLLDRYNNQLKSSSLRSISTSFSSVLKENEIKTSEFLTSQKSSKSNSKLLSEENLLISNLTTTLDHAKLNGLLDRTFLREITMQISLLITLENQLLHKTKNSTLQAHLQASLANLTNLHQQFSSYHDKTN